MLNRLFAPTCVRPGCGHRNPKESEFCEKCGISLGFNRPAILEGNRWSPAPDEVAAVFKFKALQGFFTKNLFVPPGMKAWILQANHDSAIVLEEGEHSTESLFQRLNNFFRSPHGEVLICRTDAASLDMHFSGVISAEFLPLNVDATINVRVRDVHAFKRRFMLRDGTVTTEDLTGLLQGVVQHTLKESLARRGVDEMLAEPALRTQLDRELQLGLELTLKNLGLALDGFAALTIRHEALDAQNQKKGQLWLLRREAQMQDEDDRTRNEIYDKREWDAIEHRARELRRRERMGQLDREEAALADAARTRQIEEYERIQNAQTREAGIRMGAADSIAALENEYVARRRTREQSALKDSYQRDSEKAEWEQLQALARIKAEGERDAAKLRAASLARFEAERIDRELERQAIAAELQTAELIADAEQRGEAQRALHQQEMERRGLVNDLARRQHEATVADLDIAVQARKGEARRIQQWEDELLLIKIDEARIGLGTKSTDAAVDTSRKWMLLSQEADLNELQNQLLKSKAAFEQEHQAEDRALARRRQEQEDQRKAEREKAEDDRARLALLGSLPEEVVVSLTASGANVDAIVELARIKAFKGMSPEQILAAQGSRSALGASPAPAFDSNAFAKAMVGEISGLVNNLQQGQGARHEQETSNLMRTHEGSRHDLLEAMRLMKDVALGTAQAAHPASAVVPSAPVWAAAPQPVQPVSYAAPVRSAATYAGHCPTCHAPAEAHQNYCTRCGEKLLDHRPANPSAAPRQGGPGLQPCPKCGEWGAISARYCWCCNHSIRS